jgi:hypothetical protein
MRGAMKSRRSMSAIFVALVVLLPLACAQNETAPAAEPAPATPAGNGSGTPAGNGSATPASAPAAAGENARVCGKAPPLQRWAPQYAAVLATHMECSMLIDSLVDLHMEYHHVAARWFTKNCLSCDLRGGLAWCEV